MSGRLINPKTWDQIVGIYGTHFGQFRDCFGGCVKIYAINYGLGVFGP